MNSGDVPTPTADVEAVAPRELKRRTDSEEEGIVLDTRNPSAF